MLTFHTKKRFARFVGRVANRNTYRTFDGLDDRTHKDIGLSRLDLMAFRNAGDQRRGPGSR
ncbi:MAG: DUF1127 domain-containing protein [Fimbriimonadaceae bacterium]|nr:DUF1127 domain-containing protein [Alphaproteobacteria bacterium]